MADDKQFSRRDFLKVSGTATGGVLAGTLLGSVVTGSFMKDDNDTDNANQSETNSANKESDKETKNYSEARMFFTRFEDFQVLEEATETIYPEDDNGPGAIQLGVPYFIDKQLASQWGDNSNDFRQGPFTNASVDESSITRGKMFLVGLRTLDDYSNKEFDKGFIDLSEDDKIKALQALENDEVDMPVIDSSIFFALLRNATFEGAYADPLYGGNKNMDGWRMKEYPGPVMSYEDMIESKDFVEIDPISLTDYQQK